MSADELKEKKTEGDKAEEQGKESNTEEPAKESSEGKVQSSAGESSQSVKSPEQNEEPEVTQTTEVKDEDEPCSSGQGQKTEAANSEETPRRNNATMVDMVAKHKENLFTLIEKKQENLLSWNHHFS